MLRFMGILDGCKKENLTFWLCTRTSEPVNSLKGTYKGASLAMRMQRWIWTMSTSWNLINTWINIGIQRKSKATARDSGNPLRVLLTFSSALEVLHLLESLGDNKNEVFLIVFTESRIRTSFEEELSQNSYLLQYAYPILAYDVEAENSFFICFICPSRLTPVYNLFLTKAAVLQIIAQRTSQGYGRKAWLLSKQPVRLWRLKFWRSSH